MAEKVPLVKSHSSGSDYSDLEAEACKDRMRHRIAEKGYRASLSKDKISVSSSEEGDTPDMRSTCCHTKKATWLILPIVGLSLVILGLSIALAIANMKIANHVKDAHKDEHLICQTEACIVASGEILSQMDTSADPCEDFYQYSCGNFIATQFLGPAEKRVDQFDLISNTNTKILYQELSSKGTTIFGKESSALEKAKKMLSKCMDVITLQQQGSRPLLQLIESMGNHSLLDNDVNMETWSFSKQLLKLHQMRMFPFFSTSVTPDDRNSQVTIITLHQHGLTLDSEKDYNTTLDAEQAALYKAAFIKYGVEVCRLLGMDETASRPLMEEIYELEKRLASIFVDAKIVRNPTLSYRKMQISSLQQVFGNHIDLTQHLAKLLNHEDLTGNDDLITSTMDYFTKLKGVLDEYLIDPQKRRIVKNYFSWYLIERSTDLMSSDFEYASLILSNATDGTNSLDERWKTCTKTIDSLMSRVVGGIYIEGRFTAKDRDTVTDIVNDVKTRLLNNFGAYDWMDKDTARAAVEKAEAMKTQIGYPDYVTDTTAVDDYYKDLQLPDGYFDMMTIYRQWLMKVEAKKLDKPSDANEWHMSAPTVNAYYNPSHNMVVLPAGILRKPFYDRELPASWNYGSMAAVVGHEITHGFDDQGAQYDKNGNLENWWTNASRDAFQEASKCIVEQYSQYKVGNLSLNSELNLGENIADNGGVSLAYQAYSAKIKSGQLPKKLPALSLSDKQLFFLSFAQIWCKKTTEEYARSNLNYNSHSPGKFRVQGTFSNLKEFNEAFQCKPGAKYNPEKKCKVW